MLRSPTVRSLLGLLITLAAVTGFSWYALRQLSGLRTLQAQTIDMNRHDSLLLLEVQNDLNAVGLKLRDMVHVSGTSKIPQYQAEFERLRRDLEDSIRQESKLAPVSRRPEVQAKLTRSLEELRATSEEVFKLAREGKEPAARALASTRLSSQQADSAALVLSLLERNNEAEERADQKIASIYDGVERNIYAFLAATMIAIVLTSSYLTYSNRQIFAKLESLSRQRRVLAARLITVQEEVLRSVSRELHDEFGQILTAVSTMLARAERKGLSPDSPLRAELTEVREITHNTLEKMRSLSQMLHPAVLDDYGLAKGIEWYADVFQKQTGIETIAVVTGAPVRVTGQLAINCFRIMQEALNNAARHSGTKKAEVKLSFAPDLLTLSIRDFGSGLPAVKKGSEPGLGLIAMRERAAIVGAQLKIDSVPNGGTTVSVTVPFPVEEALTNSTQDQRIGEVAFPNS
ncbi:MAG: ATP-binding protein [Bryobacteraceae bacterium]